MSTRRATLLRVAADGLYRTGLMRGLTAVIDRTHPRRVAQVLTYHRVNDDHDPFFPSVPTAVFERQMAWLAKAYRVFTVETLVERLRRGTLPRNAIALTFDDGYRDNLTHAAPILARHGLKATIFLATGYIGSAEVPWVDRVALAFKTTRATRFVAPWGEELALTTPVERLAALERTLDDFKRRPDEDMRRIVDDVLTTLDVTDQRGFKTLMLTWGDVHALTGLGFSLGAHTVNHPILSRVSAQRAWTEILGSRTMIQSVRGTPPTAFAYPNGRPEDYTANVARLVREAGFACAVTTRFGVNQDKTPIFELRRGGPWEQHLPTFALKLAAYRRHSD